MKLSSHFEKEFVLFDEKDPEKSVSFVFPFKNVHPDHLALAAYLSFGCDTLEVESASNQFIEACSFYGIEITAKKVCDPYKGNGEKLMCYGGGADSLALHLMYPEVFLVHDYESKNSNPVLARFVRNRGGVCIRTTLRDVTPQGYATSMSMIAPAVLLAASRGVSTIMTGTPREAMFFSGGSFNVTFTGKWDKIFEAAGIHLNPSSALSEVGHMKIVADYGMAHEARWCFHMPDENCLTCPKCFRKELMLHQLGFVERSDSYWDRYDNSWVKGNVNDTVMHPGARPSWAWASKSLEGTWMKTHFPELWWLPNADFQEKIWLDAKPQYADKWDTFMNKATQHLEVMSHLDSADFMSWWDRHLAVIE